MISPDPRAVGRLVRGFNGLTGAFPPAKPSCIREEVCMSTRCKSAVEGDGERGEGGGDAELLHLRVGLRCLTDGLRALLRGRG